MTDEQIFDLYRYRTNPQPPNYDELIRNYENAVRVLARRRRTGAPVSSGKSVCNVSNGAATFSRQT